MAITDPIYYLPSQLKFTGDAGNTLDADAGVKAAFFQGLSEYIPQNAPAGVKPLFFVVSTLGGVQSTVELNLEFDGNGGVRLSGNQDPFFSISESATLNAIALGLGTIPALAGLPIIAIVGVGTALYSTYLSDSVYEIYETIQGTVDTDIQLKNANGEILAGVLYKDGLGTNETPVAVGELLSSPGGNPGYPIAEITDKIEIFKGSGTEPWEIFKLYDPDIVNNAVDIFFAGQIANFVSYGGDTSGETMNASLYVETTVNGQKEQWLFARTKANGEKIDFTQVSVDKLVFDVQGDDIKFHPEHISYAKNGVFVDFNDDSDRLYLGDESNSLEGVSNLNVGMGDDWIFGGGGNDYLKGNGGNDVIYGDYGNQLSENATGANSGSDNLFGGTGTDILFGGKGDDFLFAQSGNSGLEGDKYYGGTQTLVLSSDGTDTLNYSLVNFSIDLRLGKNDPQNQSIGELTTVREFDGVSQAIGQADEIYSIERFVLTDNTDRVTVTNDVNYTIDSINGKGGLDIIDFSELAKTVVVDLYNEQASTSDLSININELKGFGQVIGTNVVGVGAGDTFFGGNNSTIFDELDGVDILDYGFFK